MTKAQQWVRENILLVLMLCSTVLGVIIGVIIKVCTSKTFTQREVMYIGFIGDLFLQMLKCLVIPLVVILLTNAIGSMDLSLSRKVGGMTIAYYLFCSLLSSGLGVILAAIIKPGSYANTPPPLSEKMEPSTLVDSILDLIRNLFPPNLVGATMESYKTKLNQTNPNETDIYKWHITSSFKPIPNVLGIIIICIVVGISISKLKPQLIITLFGEASLLIMKLTYWVIWCSPIGILFILIAQLISEDISIFIGALGIYCGICIAGVIIHCAFVMPLIYFLFTKRNPYIYMRHVTPAMVTGFGTASSAAALPLNMACVEQKNNVSPRITRFVLPIGATLNMNGTALFVAVATIYISQVRQCDMNIGNYFVIWIVAVLVSTGTAGIPSGGIVTIITILNSINLPADDVSLIISVDWIVDHFVTVANILGDAYAAGIIGYLTRNNFATVENT